MQNHRYSSTYGLGYLTNALCPGVLYNFERIKNATIEVVNYI